MKYKKGLIEARISLFVLENFKDSLPENRFKLIREIAFLAREIEEDLGFAEAPLRDSDTKSCFEKVSRKTGLSYGF